MSKAAYHQRGETLDYTNTGSSAIEAGTILTIGKRIGVASTLIQPKALGAVDVVGVFNMPKTSQMRSQWEHRCISTEPESQRPHLQMSWRATQWPTQPQALKKSL